MRSYQAAQSSVQVGNILRNPRPHYNTYRTITNKANPCEMQRMNRENKAYLYAWVGQEVFSEKNLGHKENFLPQIVLYCYKNPRYLQNVSKHLNRKVPTI